MIAPHRPIPARAVAALLWEIRGDLAELERDARCPVDRLLLAIMRSREQHVREVLRERRRGKAAA